VCFALEFGRIFCGAKRRKKPGYPLQFLGFAYANPAGFPLLSLARIKNGIPAIFNL
jgi:hypothetical protein